MGRGRGTHKGLAKWRPEGVGGGNPQSGRRHSPALDHQLVTSGFITVLNGVTGSLDISVPPSSQITDNKSFGSESHSSS